MTGNTFRNLNVAVHGAGAAQGVSLSGNRWIGEFTGPGERDDNRGVRRLSLGDGDTVVFEGSDPTQSTYRQLLGGAPAVLLASTMPAAGGYVAGQFVRCGTPRVEGGPGPDRLAAADHRAGPPARADWTDVWPRPRRDGGGDPLDCRSRRT